MQGQDAAFDDGLRFDAKLILVIVVVGTEQFLAEEGFLHLDATQAVHQQFLALLR